ncbi:hypothetical protein BELL_0304g00090 [Botrytis elliptica]|uniref:Uncharacterized protein n=1 Tax=Botrytis elliptica TaxID=278938 RepID=A0A4Z1JLG1_9HELO|nr:hypothetical protein BELL_0304g00090 [Botrytis elliptica]
MRIRRGLDNPRSQGEWLAYGQQIAEPGAALYSCIYNWSPDQCIVPTLLSELASDKVTLYEHAHFVAMLAAVGVNVKSGGKSVLMDESSS